MSAHVRNGTTIAITGGARVGGEVMDLVTAGTVNTSKLQRAVIQGAEAALWRANTWMHAEPKGFYFMKAAGYTPKWVESSRAFCPRCLQWLHDTGAVVTSEYTAFWP